MPRVLVASLILFTAACSGSSGGAITDSEVDAIKTTRSSLTTTDEFATPDVVHVRLAWGLLAWAGKGFVQTSEQKGTKPTGTDWTGGLTLSDGTATLDMSTFFEKGDSALNGEANQVKWNSHTYPHFDGVIATLKPGSSASTVAIVTPNFEKTLSISELVQGGEVRFPVDAAGHEFSISALPDEDASCSNFVVGFVRDSSFKGLVLSNLGDRLGKLRFDILTDGTLGAEQVDLNGEVVASGTGTIDAAAHTFTLSIGKSTVSGLYADPSYSNRGSFQATSRCAN